jgi:hypothetical protein
MCFGISQTTIATAAIISTIASASIAAYRQHQQGQTASAAANANARAQRNTARYAAQAGEANAKGFGNEAVNIQ